ncbi:hypothetical protein [Rubellicoccus peritrichatus]|uniref:Uncharacterized protein n=1 Tax=Rubellicoccus peritrichatus TaxID=3080537 RepID=A0AAQ3L7L0_9BACT|nr:hypothetical protein [Puniceicoccus sp. CR14]WOO39324.1 hypothetical protein RZN69_11930 [Puniceicoccus sp. CR14]
MNSIRSFALIASIGLAAVFTGCSSSHVENDTTGLYAKNNRGTNVLGIVDTSPASYKHIPEATDVIHSDELYKRKNISGNNVSLFWGAITFADY